MENKPERIISLFSKIPPSVRFILTGLFLYVLWIILYEGIFKPHQWIDPWLTQVVSAHSVRILRLLGYVASDRIIESGTVLYNGTQGMLRIAFICDGLILNVIFMIFIVAFPGPVRHKCWFIPAGFFLIYLINLFRVVMLMIIRIHKPEYLHFNHKYTFTMIVYGFIFMLWYTWVRKFSSMKIERK